MQGETLAAITHLHDLYCVSTGLVVRLNPHRLAVWKNWMEEGFDPDDLRTVIKFIKQRIKEGVRREESFKFDLLITPDREAGFSRFENDLALARKVFRKREPEQAVNREVKTPDGVVNIRDHIQPAEVREAQRMDLGLLADSIRGVL